jgi:DinB superfamily
MKKRRGEIRNHAQEILEPKEESMSRLQLAIDQIAFARNYTVRLLDQTRAPDWFRQPPGGITHLAWQVGHLAMAEYRLTLERIRGSLPHDNVLISEEFLRLFGRDSVPDADPGKYPAQAEIRAVFDVVHQQTMAELPNLEESELDKPPLKPHSLAQTKLWSLLWCAQHEAVHAGQIGLLRRLLGYPPAAT